MIGVRVSSLDIKNLRIIREARIEPAERVNWIIGGNGAGKTSLLEAVFLLARGRSFRNSRYGSLLTNGAQKLSLKGRVAGEDRRGTVELVFGSGRKRLFENGHLVRRVRDIKDRIQVRVIAENSQGLLEGEPALRRLFLDWNLFHVEQSYADMHSSFRRILTQRNAWLRRGAAGPRVWDDAYIDLSEKITTIREKYVKELSHALEQLQQSHPVLPLVRTVLRRGWPDGKALGDVLSASFQQDLQRGYTRLGPARADLLVSINGLPGIGSRGQVKVAVCLIQLAAQNVGRERGNGPCVWLLDDLGAELDRFAVSRVWEAFLGAEEQIFVTDRDADTAFSSAKEIKHSQVFHVEHGAILQ